jgi:hypothetical protein
LEGFIRGKITLQVAGFIYLDSLSSTISGTVPFIRGGFRTSEAMAGIVLIEMVPFNKVIKIPKS